MLSAPVAAEIDALMHYPADSAGQLMDTRVVAFHADLTAQEALRRLRQRKRRGLKDLFPVVAGQSGSAGAQTLAVTMRGLVLREISLRYWPRGC